MSDAQDIETAYRMIEGYVGDGEIPDMPLAVFLAEMRTYSEPEDWARFEECGLWAVGVAWKRYQEVWN